MIESILKRFPELTKDDVNLMDNGEGVFVNVWNSDKPKPTKEELQSWFNEDDFVKVKQDKKDELDEACTNTILGRFKVTLNGVEYEFSFDMEAQSRFNGTGILFLGNKITEVPWTAYANGERVRIPLTKDDFDIVSMAALNHQNNNIIRYNQLLLDVDNASKDELPLIVW
jgi:hypothetical protein